MKTTIDLPEDVLHRANLVATQRHTTLDELVLDGLDRVLGSAVGSRREDALERLQKGLRLGGKPLTREESHERHQVS